MKKIANVPVMLQMEAVECGAVSLNMILAYYGKFIPIEDVHISCGVSRDGSNAKNIARAAMSYGLKVKAYKKEVGDLKNMPMPAVIHWNFNHFVVLDGFNKKGAVLNDPERGRVVVSYDEFDRSFTGIVLCMQPGENFIKEGKKKNSYNLIINFFKENKLSAAMLIATGIMMAAIKLVIPLFSGFFIDNVLLSGNTKWLPLLFSAMLITMILQSALFIVDDLLMLKMRVKIALVSGAKFMWHMLSLPVMFFSQRYIGDISTRQEDNVDVADILCLRILPAALDCIMIIIYLSVMLYTSPLLAAMGIGAAALNIALMYYISLKRGDKNREMQRNSGKLAGVTAAGVDMVETIKCGGTEESFFKRWSGFEAKSFNSCTEFDRINILTDKLPELIMELTNITVLTIGILYVLSGKFTVGILTAFLSLMSEFLSPVNSFVQTGGDIQKMCGMIERIDDCMQYPVKEGRPLDPESELKKIDGDVTAENLTFGYNRLDSPFVDNFSIHIEKGKSVALVGGSGSGKSTIARLIVGLYEKWSGEVLFDNIPRGDYPDEIFYSCVAVVDQDISMFEGTIKDNITMWDNTIEDAELNRACRDACIYDVVTERSGGYMAEVLEGGSNFSGGQRQRFEIAKALVRNPSVIILDEATSALDQITEKRIMDAVKQRGITSIIVAHRLSTIRDCDEIIVLERGKIIQRGTHEELMKDENGLYYSLNKDE